MDDRLLSLSELAELLGIKPETIYEWRYKGIGPPAYRLGGNSRSGLLRFKYSEVMAWLETRSDEALKPAEIA